MTSPVPTPEQAASALAEVAGRRRQVVASVEVFPWWGFPLYGLGLALYVAARDLPPGSPWAWASLLAMPVALGSVVVASVRRRVRLDLSMAGLRFGLVIAAGAVLLPVLVIGPAAGAYLWAEKSEFTLLWTVTGVVLGLLLAVGGDVFRRALKWALVSGTEETGR